MDYVLRASQRAEIAKVITGRGLSPRAFEWSVAAGVPKLWHKDQPHLAFVFHASDRGTMYPGEDYEPSTEVAVTDWDELLSAVAIWLEIVQAELDAVDPWADPVAEAPRDASARGSKLPTGPVVPGQEVR